MDDGDFYKGITLNLQRLSYFNQKSESDGFSYFISPYMDNGEFMDTRKGLPSIPLDANFVKAYNLALKCQLMISKIKEDPTISDKDLSVKNESDWFAFVKEHTLKH